MCSGVVDFHSELSPIPPFGQQQSDSACSSTDKALGQTVTLGNQLKAERFKTRDVVQRFRALVALLEDLGSVLSTHVWHLITTCNSGWLLVHTYTDIYT